MSKAKSVVTPVRPVPEPLQRAAADHGAYQAWLAQSGGNGGGQPDGDRELERQLNRHAAKPRGGLVFSGRTVSPLLARWTSRFAANHPEVPVFFHHVGCTAESRSLPHLLLRLLETVRGHCDLREPIPASLEARLDILPNWLARLSARGRCVLVLDRLDALDGVDEEQAVGWLPDWIPGNLRLVIGVAPGAAAELLRQKGLQVEDLEHIRDTHALHANSGDKSGDTHLSGQTREIQNQDTHACAQTRDTHGQARDGQTRDTHADQQTRDTHADQNPVLPEAADQMVREAISKAGDGAVQMLSLLWAARRGLSQQTLEALLPGQDMAAIQDALDQQLFMAGGRVTLAGPELRDAVRRQLLRDGGDRQTVHGRIAKQFAGNLGPDGLDELPWQLVRTADWTALGQALGERRMLARMLGPDWRADLLACWEQWGSGEELVAFYGSRLAQWQGGADSDLASLVLQLAAALRGLPDAGSLEPFYRRVLALSADSTANLATVNSAYGAWLADQERLDEAEPLLREALDFRMKENGPDHVDTRTTRHQLAMLLEARGDLAAATVLYRETLQQREQVLGKNHRELIPHLSNLAALLKADNALAAARPLYQRALQIAERHYGNTHPGTAACVDNLAGLLYAGNDFAPAEDLYQRALGVAEAVFGPDHPATAASAHNLGTVMDAREQFKVAETLFRRALAIRQNVLGEDHMDTASSLHNLAGVLDAMGRYGDAEPMYRRAVETWEKVVGQDHPATATSVNNLADLLREKGEYAEAEGLYQRNLQTWTALLGERHAHTVMTRSELAIMYADQKRTDLAEPLLREAAEQTAEVMGPDSMQHINTITRLAALLRDAGRRDEGAELLRKSLMRAEGQVSLLSPRVQKLRRHLEALQAGTDTLH